MGEKKWHGVVYYLLWALILLAIGVLFGGCHFHEDRKPILIEGGIICQPNGKVLVCSVRLEEQIDE